MGRYEVKLSSNGASPAAGLQLKEGPGFLLVTVIDAGAAQDDLFCPFSLTEVGSMSAGDSGLHLVVQH